LNPVSLGETDDPAAIPYLVEYLSSPNQNDVRLAASGIGKLAEHHRAECNRAIPDLLLALTNPGPQVRQYALKTLSKLDVRERDHLKKINVIAEDNREKDYNRNLARKILSKTRPGSRPFQRESIEQLEDRFCNAADDREILQKIHDELNCRKNSKRNQRLKQKIEAILEGTRHDSGPRPKKAKKKAVAQKKDSKKTPKQSIPASVQPENRSEWEHSQRVVIEFDSTDALLVDAGPGSGKTHVACHRVAQFINDGIDASQILLISFTRAAIKELRERIEEFTNEKSAVSGLKIITLDSFTWEILRGLSDNEPARLLQGYNENIRRFIEMLNKPAPDLRNFLDELEHVIVDEAQDLIADRADLVIRLIEELPNHCGFTVFADPAQSIYGFTSEDEGLNAKGSLTLVDRIQRKEVTGFSNKQLTGNFRTADAGLIELFSGLRQRLLGREQGDKDSWLKLKADIQSMASGTVPAISEQRYEDGIETLVLCRTRAEVLQGSSFLRSNNLPHKIRMSGIEGHIHAWIGRVFSEFPEDTISETQFNELWRKRIGDSAEVSQEEKDPGAAWRLLEDHVWDRGRVSVRRLREVLMRPRPPVDFVVDEKTFPGPVIGTIHSSKGREADHVHLMLPPDSFVDRDDFPPAALAEEERVMFVGATRARRKLFCGEGSQTYSRRLPSSGRVFRRPRGRNSPKLQFEVGLSGDINHDSIISKESGYSVEDLLDLQDWLWMQRVAVLPVYSIYEEPDNELWCEHDGEDIWIGHLSKQLQKDLFQLARRLSKETNTELKPPNKIPFLWMAGVTTRVIPPGVREAACTPYCHSGFMLAPVVTGFPTAGFFPKSNSSAD